MVFPGETKEEDIEREVFADVEPIGRDEFSAAGQAGMRARNKYTVWEEDYKDDNEIIDGETRLTIYRTYGTTTENKIELYAGERVGNV